MTLRDGDEKEPLTVTMSQNGVLEMGVVMSGEGGGKLKSWRVGKFKGPEKANLSWARSLQKQGPMEDKVKVTPGIRDSIRKRLGILQPLLSHLMLITPLGGTRVMGKVN